MKEIEINNHNYQLPIFCPDATRGVIRGLDATDLRAVGVNGLVVNAFHLLTEPGISVIKKSGGIKKFMNWDGLIISDSGGFQLLSLIHRDASLGKINDKGISFNKTVNGKKKKYGFTPEKSIQIQFDLGSDIMVCLDDCPRENAGKEEIEVSVRRTIGWAKRCKIEFDKQIRSRKISDYPKLIGVIQGGDDRVLRNRCAEELMLLDFDGYGFGGWPMKDGKMNYDLLNFTAGLVPDTKIRYALGVGKPNEIKQCHQMGYDIFDCVLPTRDGRHGRLFMNDGREIDLRQEKYVRDFRPVDEKCACFVCQSYSRAYIHHLFMIGDSLAGRLGSMHNLFVYQKIINEQKLKA